MSFLGNSWFLARKDVQYMLLRRETIIWTFLMPVVFFYFIGTVTGGFAGGAGKPDLLEVRAPDDAGFLADRLVTRLEDRGFEVVRPELADSDGSSPGRRIVLPPGFTRRALAGEQVTVELLLEGRGLGDDFDEIRVQRAVYTVVADLAAAAALRSAGAEGGGGLESDAGSRTLAALADLDDAEPRLTLSVSSAGEKREIPSGFDQAVPGTMVMFTLLVLLTSGTAMLVVERRQGLLRRLASAPISRGSVVLGKWGARMILGLVQVGFAMLLGRFVFGTDWGPSLAMVVAVLVAWASLAASLAILLGCFARTEGQATGLGILAGNVLAALGGCWWPIEVTPAWMQDLAGFLPTGITMDAMHRLVNFGLPATSAAPHVLLLLVLSLAAGWLAARVFRYE